MKIVETSRAIFMENIQGNDDFTSNPRKFAFEEGKDAVTENENQNEMVAFWGQMDDVDVDDNHEDQLHVNNEEGEYVQVQHEIEVHAGVTNGAYPIMQQAQP